MRLYLKHSKVRYDSSHTTFGVVHKPWADRITIGLVYPNSSWIGMSNLGFQTVYHLINADDDFVCERFFLPPQGKRVKGRSMAILSEESKKPPLSFKILAFSIAFENDFLNVYRFLRQAKIPVYREHRTKFHPMIAVGGTAVSINPEAIADYLDIVFLGEAEAILPEVLTQLSTLRGSPWDRKQVIHGLRICNGVYVPGAYRMSYNARGFIEHVEVQSDYPEKISPAKVKKLDTLPVFSRLITSDTEFGNHFLMEITRGCSQRCKFCFAGWGYHPIRIRTKETLLSMVEHGIAVSRTIGRPLVFGLVGSSISDNPWLNEVMEHIISQGFKFSLSSLPIDFADKENLKLLKLAGIKSVTIAPETGSDTLRNVICKKWNNERIFRLIEILPDFNISKLRLYFMIGLPGETLQDVRDIGRFIKKIQHLLRKRGTTSFHIHCSINVFIPKPHTPFERMPMVPLREIKEKLKLLRKTLKNSKKLTITNETPKWSRIQAMLSRGDRKVAHFVEALVNNNGNVAKAASEVNLNVDFYLSDWSDESLPTPWQHLNP